MYIYIYMRKDDPIVVFVLATSVSIKGSWECVCLCVCAPVCVRMGSWRVRLIHGFLGMGAPESAPQLFLSHGRHQAVLAEEEMGGCVGGEGNVINQRMGGRDGEMSLQYLAWQWAGGGGRGIVVSLVSNRSWSSH